MQELLLIDAGVRDDSRTRRLAEHLVVVLRDLGDPLVVHRVRLEETGIHPLDGERLAERDRLLEREAYDAPMFRWAKEFAAADVIVMAAPCWDLSFPAALKAYVEAVNVTGITFRYGADGVPNGLCRAKRLYYITTAGGPIYEKSFGFGYIETLAKNFWGVPDVRYYAAENLDIDGADVERIMAAAMAAVEQGEKE